MNTNITVSGLDAFSSSLDTWLSEKITKTDEAVQGAGLDCEAGAKQRAPVDTGRLRASIQYQNVGPAECTVGTNVEYAGYVELGTSRQSPQPYLFPAFAESSAKLQDELKTIWNS